MNKTITYKQLQSIISKVKYQKNIILLMSITIMLMSFTIMLQSINSYNHNKQEITTGLISSNPIPDSDLAEYMELIQD